MSWQPPRSIRPLSGIAAQIRAHDNAALDAAALLLERAIKLTLSTPGRGRLYRRRRGSRVARTAALLGIQLRGKARAGRFVVHQASAPGDPPAVDYGRLRASTYTDRKFRAREVGVSAHYAKHLEFGTARIKPRPFLRPALKAVERELGIVIAGGLRLGPRRSF